MATWIRSVAVWVALSSAAQLLNAVAVAAEVPATLPERGAHPAGGAEALQIFRAGYPRAYFFRAAEGHAANPRIGYEQWEKTYNRLMGIEGKVLDEEVPGRSRRNVEFFSRFKRSHPDQLVLLHYNGNARDPRHRTKGYFAGHWVYYNGTTIVSDVPAEPGETNIQVANPRLFQVNMGRYRDKNEDIGLCELDEQGRPNWFRSEQVQLVSIDYKSRTIRVRRGCYGTRPRGFVAGKAYAAAHVCTGPWGRRSNLLWRYDYSTRCPRDMHGRRCLDVHAEELARLFLPGGPLAAFDGIEFDVLNHQCAPKHTGGSERGLDCDADGRIDNGFFDGVNLRHRCDRVLPPAARPAWRREARPGRRRNGPRGAGLWNSQRDRERRLAKPERLGDHRLVGRAEPTCVLATERPATCVQLHQPQVHDTWAGARPA